MELRTAYMMSNGIQCDDWKDNGNLKRYCSNKAHWVSGKFCQKACCDVGFGYEDCPSTGDDIELRPSTGGATECTDEPSRWMINQQQTCATWDKLTSNCNTNVFWRDNKYCQQSCFDLKLGYKDDDCSNNGPRCVDDATWAYKSKSLNCAWTKGLRYRCNRTERNKAGGRTANDACPATCGSCAR